MKLRTLTATAAALAISASAFAATDGTLGPTSTGTADVSFTLNPAAANQIQITGMDDLLIPDAIEGDNFDTSGAGGTACIYSPGALNYSVEISATNLVGQNTATAVPYRFVFAPILAGVVDQSKVVTVPTSGGAPGTQSGIPSSQDASCTDQQELYYQVNFDSSLNPLPTVPDTYGAMMTIIVTPE